MSFSKAIGDLADGAKGALSLVGLAKPIEEERGVNDRVQMVGGGQFISVSQQSVAPLEQGAAVTEHLLASVDKPADKETQGERWYPLGAMDWTTAQGKFASVGQMDFPEAFKQDRLAIAGLLAYHTYVRYTLELQIIINPTNFQQGLLMVAVLPPAVQTRASYAAYLTLPSGILNCNINNTVTIRVPFVHTRNLATLHALTGGPANVPNLRLTVRVLSQLRNATGTSSDVSIKVIGRMTDLQLHGIRPRAQMMKVIIQPSAGVLNLSNPEGTKPDIDLAVGGEGWLPDATSAAGLVVKDLTKHIETSCYVFSFSIITTAAKGTKLATWLVKPEWRPETYQGQKHPSNLTALAQYYTYWRGDIVFDIIFAATKFHSCRLMISFIPGQTTAPTYGEAESSSISIFDINGVNSTASFRVPYVSDRPYVPTFESIGVVTVWVVNRMTAPANVSNTVECTIMMKGADTFAFYAPALTTIVGQAGDDDAEIASTPVEDASSGQLKQDNIAAKPAFAIEEPHMRASKGGTFPELKPGTERHSRPHMTMMNLLGRARFYDQVSAAAEDFQFSVPIYFNTMNAHLRGLLALGYGYRGPITFLVHIDVDGNLFSEIGFFPGDAPVGDSLDVLTAVGMCRVEVRQTTTIKIKLPWYSDLSMVSSYEDGDDLFGTVRFHGNSNTPFSMRFDIALTPESEILWHCPVMFSSEYAFQPSVIKVDQDRLVREKKAIATKKEQQQDDHDHRVKKTLVLTQEALEKQLADIKQRCKELEKNTTPSAKETNPFVDDIDPAIGQSGYGEEITDIVSCHDILPGDVTEQCEQNNQSPKCSLVRTTFSNSVSYWHYGVLVDTGDNQMIYDLVPDKKGIFWFIECTAHIRCIPICEDGPWQIVHPAVDDEICWSFIKTSLIKPQIYSITSYNCESWAKQATMSPEGTQIEVAMDMADIIGNTLRTVAQSDVDKLAKDIKDKQFQEVLFFDELESDTDYSDAEEEVKKKPSGDREPSWIKSKWKGVSDYVTSSFVPSKQIEEKIDRHAKDLKSTVIKNFQDAYNSIKDNIGPKSPFVTGIAKRMRQTVVSIAQGVLDLISLFCQLYALARVKDPDVRAALCVSLVCNVARYALIFTKDVIDRAISKIISGEETTKAMSDDLAETICDLAADAFGALVYKNTTGQSFMSCVKNLTVVSAGFVCVKNCMNMVKELLNAAKIWCCPRSKEAKLHSVLKKAHDIVPKLCEQASQLSVKIVRTHAEKSEHVQQCVEAHQRLNTWYRWCLSSDQPKYAALARGISHHLAQLSHAIQENDCQRTDPTRPEPFVVYIYGEPGGGKSILTNALAAALAIENGGGKEDIYSKPLGAEFWDGYAGQAVVIMDDLGQDASGEDFMHFCQMVSCNPVRLNHAALSDKGGVFSSNIIVASSNQPIPKPGTITTQAAVLRRMHCIVQVTPHPNCVTASGTLSIKKAKDGDMLQDMSCLTISRMRWNKPDKTEPKMSSLVHVKDISFDDLVETVCMSVEHRVQMDKDMSEVFFSYQPKNYAKAQSDDEVFTFTSRPKNGKSMMEHVEVKDPLTPPTMESSRVDWDIWRGREYDLEKQLNLAYDAVSGNMPKIKALDDYISRCVWTQYELDAEQAKKVKDALAWKEARSLKWKSIMSKFKWFCVIVGVIGIAMAAWSYFTKDPVEASSPYDVQQANIKSVVKAKASDEGQSFKDRTRLAMANTCKLGVSKTVNGKATYTWVGHCLFVAGRTCVTTLHSLHGADGIVIKNKGVNTAYSSADYILDEVPESDLAFITLNQGEQHRDISKLFIQHDQIQCIGNVTGAVCFNADGESYPMVSVKYCADKTYAHPTEGVEDISVVGLFTALGRGVPGCCGMPWVSHSSSIDCAIIGIHCAGNAASSWCTIVTQELIQKHMGATGQSKIRAITDFPNKLSVATKTKLKPSVLSEFVPCTKQPAALGEWDRRSKCDPWGVMFNKWISGVKPEPRYWSRHVDSWKQRVKPLRAIASDHGIHLPTSLDEVIEGIPGMEGLDMKTSAGYPWAEQNIRKKDIITKYRDVLEEQVNAIENYIMAPGQHKPEVIYINYLKDELLPSSKVECGATRIICGAPIQLVCAWKKVFGAAIATVHTEHVRDNYTGCCVGIDPDIAWTDIDTSGMCICIDYSKFDGSMQTFNIEGALRILGYIAGLMDEQSNRAAEFIYDVRSVWGQSLVHTVGPLPSGCPSTSIIGSIANVMALTLAMVHASGQILPVVFDNVRVLTYGDDVLAHLTPAFVEVLDTECMVSYLHSTFGMVATGVSKDVAPSVTSEPTFLKRGFRQCSVVQLVHPTISVETIYQILAWTRRGTDFQQHVDAAMNFAMHHGEQFYDKVREIIDTSSTYLTYSYADLHEKWVSVVTMQSADCIEQIDVEYHSITAIPDNAIMNA
ncbi:polyprotein [fipivirus E1]|uniref:Genome polyprotein n=1 Tax=fipivirus E1 TaxID=2116189 RepID=A0A2P1GN85_9PICO|nr:polyprotein [fipivirus E1]AVM87440.1 polyprotein [fipivirus E1]